MRPTYLSTIQPTVSATHLPTQLQLLPTFPPASGQGHGRKVAESICWHEYKQSYRIRLFQLWALTTLLPTRPPTYLPKAAFSAIYSSRWQVLLTCSYPAVSAVVTSTLLLTQPAHRFLSFPLCLLRPLSLSLSLENGVCFSCSCFSCSGCVVSSG